MSHVVSFHLLSFHLNMTENKKVENQDQTNPSKEEIQYHVSPTLEYSYRDICQVYLGKGDVVLEFGNHHRSTPGHVTISNRIVLTMSNAYALQQTLQKALHAAQLQMQQQMSS